ncbi:MAG: LysR family transcriptional regulator [Anaerolineales bacterium]|nr:LysR family transcriptional regulator [Anaerolineales bacterium]
MLDAHQLNVFLIAAETLNFTEAAQRLHMSQPSVSQHIQSLEQQFGLPLFNRAGRHLELTEAGIMLVPLAREMVGRSVQIKETMESLKGDVYGHLLVGCSTTPGKYVLPQLLAEFHRHHPRVRVTCQVAPQKTALQTLCDGEVHFALASEYLISCKDVEFRQFMVDPVVLICPLNHPWAARTEIEPEELREADFILREENSGTRTVMRAGLEAHGIAEDELNVLLTLGNSEAIAIAVQEGIGVGFVSKLVYTRLVENRVATVKIRGMELERDIFIGRNTRIPASAAQTAFWGFIATHQTIFTGQPLNLPAEEEIYTTT